MGGANERSPDDIPTTVDPVELALERVRDDNDKDIVLRFLTKQEALADAQMRESMAHVAQLGRERWRDVIISLIGLCILAIGGLLVWDAAQARGVAIEPFRVPADLEARGLDGVVVATQVMDQLFAMQSATESIRAPSTYANNWGEDIAVEIPNTGVTIGDLRSSLRVWFGQQVRLTGEIVRLPDGRVAITVRVGSDAGERFTAAEEDFDSLVEQAAEAIYRRTQPYRYSIWLRNHARTDEATQIATDLAAGREMQDRLWAINTLAARTPDVEAAIRQHERGLRLDPQFTPILYNIANLELAMGREGKALHYMTRLLDAEDVARRQINPERVEQVLLSARSTQAMLQRDMTRACDLARQGMDNPSGSLTQMLAPLTLVDCYGLARDVRAARQLLADVGLDDPVRMREHIAELSPDAELESGLAAALDDWETAYLILKDVVAAVSEPNQPTGPLIDQTFLTNANLALAAAHTGRISEAREIMADAPNDCTACVRVRGTIEALAGDATAARRQFETAIQQGANLPATYGEYAEALVILRDWRGAIAQAQKAARLAPRWADPHMAWGDALVGLGELRGAIGRYREAERLAPNWGAAKLALGRAYSTLGDDARARDARAKAADLPLSPGDRAEVGRLLR